MGAKLRGRNAETPCLPSTLRTPLLVGRPGIRSRHPSKPAGYRQVLDEIRETGHVGTELGDWGFMPPTPSGCGRRWRPVA